MKIPCSKPRSAPSWAFWSTILKRAPRPTRPFWACLCPPVQMTGVYEDAHTTYLGQPTKARCKQAFFYYGDLEVELLEPDHEPSVWRQALDENGEGLHHVAFRVQGMDEMIRRGESQGMKLLQRGRWATGHYAYLDATESLHVIIELLENGQFEV